MYFLSCGICEKFFKFFLPVLFCHKKRPKTIGNRRERLPNKPFDYELGYMKQKRLSMLHLAARQDLPHKREHDQWYAIWHISSGGAQAQGHPAVEVRGQHTPSPE